MKKYFWVLCFITTSNIYSQAYYPGLDNLFLTSDADESLFSNDLLYLRTFLKESTKRMFFADLQSAISSNGTTGFYSLSLIPRGNKSNPILNSGINLIFDPKLPTKIPRIDITVNEIIKEENNIKSLSGYLIASNEGLILEFPNTIIIPLATDTNNNIKEEKKCQFLIRKIDYELSANKFKATIEGKFESLIKFTKNDKAPKKINSIIIDANKNEVTINISYIDQKDKNQKFIIIQKIK